MATPIFADDPIEQVLGMVVSATLQEKAIGFSGWVKPPKAQWIREALDSLVADGLVEYRQGINDEWWRATPKALSQVRHVAPSSRSVT